MRNIGRLTLLAGIAATLPFTAVASPAQKAPKPKLTLARAQAIALKARPGKVTDHELEAEKGGSGLRYSFDIKAGGKGYEVGVDAVTGKVLENIVEGPNPD
ncbi:PepSY domain-containing protein [Sphingomonas kyeonggiensis]|uniref:Putative membrane protein YkoI n=1 Tax=Sphingomonas kyeonggiensis TaxID=1268553 RepID=A0A7W6NZ95_9SPHN|nr:PepSY domain-containing protein [Sphingomonas kyeonggiensis]MBB4101168.1 putative membrane protein YkoI [Sphingomonas kyeonggiensis]